jgi:hypothetical protein
LDIPVAEQIKIHCPWQSMANDKGQSWKPLTVTNQGRATRENQKPCNTRCESKAICGYLEQVPNVLKYFQKPFG